MKQFLSLCILCFLLATAVPAYADIARPKPSPSPQQSRIVLHTSLTIVPDNKAYQARCFAALAWTISLAPRSPKSTA